MNDIQSEVIKDLSQALFWIVSSICLIVKTFQKKKHRKRSKRKR